MRDSAGRQLTVMAYVMTDGDRWRSPALPSEYYYQGILDGYRQIGLPTQALKQAWDHCVGEVQRETERSNRRACSQLSPRQKKGPER